MKKFVLAIFTSLCVAVQLHAQECEIIPFKTLDMMYPATQLNLPGNYYLDLSKINLLDPSVKNLSSNAAYKAYIAPSDSSIMVFLVDNQVSFFKLCSSKKECDSLQRELYIEQVVIKEFNRLQPAGVFRGSAAEADSLIRHIIHAINNLYNSKESYDISLSSAVYYGSKKTEGQNEAGFVIPVSSLCINKSIGQEIYFCGLIDTVRQCGADFVNESSTALKFPVQRVFLPGMRFHAFDMNGNLIRSGRWHEEYADEFRTPAVVRFENGVSIRYSRAKSR